MQRPIAWRRHLIGLAVLFAILFGVAFVQGRAITRFKHKQACVDRHGTWDEAASRCTPVENGNK